jgi:CHAT domain-containing protein
MLNDLAAGYLIKADSSGSAADLARALDAAQRAVFLNSSCAAAWFNRAVALEGLELHSLAAESWMRVASLDDDGWRSEALDDAKKYEGTAFREARLSRIVRTLESANGDERTHVANGPDLMTEFVERTTLREWATAVRSRDWERTAVSARTAQREAERVRVASGDAYLPDLVHQLTSTTGRNPSARKKADGWLAYLSAIEFWENDRTGESQAQFAVATQHLGDTVPAASLWMELYTAGLERLQGKTTQARQRLAHVETSSARRGYISAHGRALWQDALLSGEAGSFGDTFKGFGAALTLFERARDRESAAVVRAMLSGLYLQLGETESAWLHQALALKGLPFARRVRRDAILTGAALLAAGDGLHAAALVFRELPIREARAAASDLGLSFLMADQAADFRALGMDSAAFEAITEAKRCLHALDPSVADMARALHNITEAEFIADTEPTAALELLSESVRLYSQRGYTFTAATTELRRGQLLARLSRLGEAEAAFQSGLANTEHERDSLTGLSDIAALQSTRWDLYTELADLYWRRNQPSKAFDLLHRGRLPALNRQRNPHMADAARVPRGTLTIVFGIVHSRVLAWVRSAARERHFIVDGGVDELHRLVDRHGALLQSGSDPAEFQAVSTRLFELLFAPVRDDLKPVTSLVLVPDGFLAQLAFGSLIDALARRFLVEEVAVSIAPGLPGFADTRMHTSAARRISSVLVVGNPDRAAATDDRVPSLPHADAEAAAVADLYTRSTLLSRAAATKRGVLEALRRASEVHFAGHAVVNYTRPELSRLLLTPDRGDTLGSLFGEEIERLRLDHVELVVLAGCGTASGRVTRGAGVMGLGQRFLYAGAKSVIATLWPIDDQQSAPLFVDFHRHWIRGLGPAEALRAAQLQALRAGKDPQYWAGVIAIVR